MRVIVLAAGQGFRLDGFHKLRIRDPRSGKPLLEHLRTLFAGHELTVVLGFQAISVMNDFPDVDYLYNEHWSITGNSYSLSLALDDRPCVVVSGDLFFDADLVKLIETAPPNSVFVQRSENKQAHSVRCTASSGSAGGSDAERRGDEIERSGLAGPRSDAERRGDVIERSGLAGPRSDAERRGDVIDRVMDLYLGEPRNPTDTETIGIYKVTDPGALRTWKRACTQNRSVFCGINLPIAEPGAAGLRSDAERREGVMDVAFAAVDKGDLFLHEVNTHLDYLNLIQRSKR